MPWYRGFHCTQSVADTIRTLANRLEEVHRHSLTCGIPVTNGKHKCMCGMCSADLHGLSDMCLVRSTLEVCRTVSVVMQVAEAAERREPATCQDIRIPEGASSIDLKARGLQHVPDQVWASAAGLQRLDLSSNQIAALPPLQLGACTALQVASIVLQASQWHTSPQCKLTPFLSQLLLCQSVASRSMAMRPVLLRQW